MGNTSWTLDDADFKQIWDRAAPYTMTSPERGYALYLSVRYIVENRIPGAFVECGVWRGGSAMIILLTLKKLGVTGRDVVLFDTFDGMTEASDYDRDYKGRSGGGLLKESIDQRDSSQIWAVASKDEVQSNLKRCGYSPNRIRLVQGDVRETLAHTQTGPIALLRLDTDFYDSTRAELINLFPRVAQGGVVVIDDYGHWAGAKRAVDEYFSERKDRLTRPLLQPIDYTGRMFVKVDGMEAPDIPRYDYVAPGLSDPQLLRYFPTLQPHDPSLVRWHYLRYGAPHIWRIDRRADPHKPIGVLSTDEAVLLYNLAKSFAGRRALEIGCHYGWSTAHLIAAGLHVDVVDPALSDAVHQQHVLDSLAPIENGTYRLWPGYSPYVIEPVRAAQSDSWSFAFIDGNHDQPGPRLDAEAVLSHCAADAMIVFHDLASPDVADGLRFCKEQGWHCKIYNTMQVMGVAWRGNVSPVHYVQDPNVPTLFFSHLRDLNG